MILLIIRRLVFFKNNVFSKPPAAAPMQAWVKIYEQY